MKIARVRITDYRPPTVGAPSPLERRHSATRGGSVPTQGPTGYASPKAMPAPRKPAPSPEAQARNTASLDRSYQRTRDTAAEHDKAVELYEPETLIEMKVHLHRMPVHDRNNAEHRWTAERRAAVSRRLIALRIL